VNRGGRPYKSCQALFTLGIYGIEWPSAKSRPRWDRQVYARLRCAKIGTAGTMVELLTDVRREGKVIECIGHWSEFASWREN
jgi:hypothetical protein